MFADLLARTTGTMPVINHYGTLFFSWQGPHACLGIDPLGGSDK